MDKYVEQVIEKYKQRSETGIKKYGTIWEIHNFQEYYHKNKKPKRIKKSKVIGNENN